MSSQFMDLSCKLTGAGNNDVVRMLNPFTHQLIELQLDADPQTDVHSPERDCSGNKQPDETLYHFMIRYILEVFL